MMRNSSIALLLSVVAATASAQTPAPDVVVERALRAAPIVDGHNDLPWQYFQRSGNDLTAFDLRTDLRGLTPPLHTDFARLRAGRVGAQFWSVYVPSTTDEDAAVVATLEQIDVVHRLNAMYPETLELALTSSDVRRIQKSGRIASLIGIEGGHSIASSLAVLRQMYAVGARYMTLTHSDNVPWADAATDAPEHDGLTAFGREVVREMNRLGMLVDLSHVSPASMADALEATEAPVIFSHSSARGVTNHPRNVPDDILARLRDTDGVVMVTFVPSFVSEELRRWYGEYEAADARSKELFQGQPEQAKEALAAWRATNPPPPASVRDVADHIDHIRKVAGIERVGLGGDFDGISSVPQGLEDVSTYPALLRELVARGYTEAELRQITGENILRVMKKVEDTAARLQKVRGPSQARIAVVDAVTAAD